MHTEINALIAISASLLTAEEKLFHASLSAQAEKARAVADDLMRIVRGMIRDALSAPVDSFDLFALLKAAVDLDGVGSALAAGVVQSLAGEAGREAA